MAKVVLYFPGNALHSFLIEDRWQRMYDAELGLHEIGRSGLPVTVSHQGMDYELYPFLRDIHGTYPNMGVANAPYSHALLPFAPPKQQRWEVRMQNGNVPVSFFSEFYSPKNEFISTEHFFVLNSQTFSYSMSVGVGAVPTVDTEVDEAMPKDTVAVNYNSRIGVLLDGFERFLKAWFAYAAQPTAENLEATMREFEALTHNPRPVIVVPLDLEQPFVGSATGSELWTLFFDQVKRRGLDRHLIDLREVLGWFNASELPKIRQPHRMLSKWTVHPIQIRYIQKLARFTLRSEKDRLLFALASASDLLSSWNRYVMRTKRPAVAIKCSDRAGNTRLLTQGHNKPLQEACLASCRVLENGDERLADKLTRLEHPNGLVTRLTEWAALHKL